MKDAQVSLKIMNFIKDIFQKMIVTIIHLVKLVIRKNTPKKKHTPSFG